MSFVDIRSQIACDFQAGGSSSEFVQNWLSSPVLAGAEYSQWWMHGQVNCQSKATGSFALPANGVTNIAMTNRYYEAPAPYSTGSAWRPSNPDYVLTTAEWGSGPESPGNTLQGFHNIHAYNRTDTSGCALAIAYKSDAKTVLPRDFVVFSVVHDCPKRQREPFRVPNLPACPNNKCICAWFWIPKNSGTKNFYMTPFVCHVTNAASNAKPVDFEYAIPPRRCLDPKNCNFGPRNPLYWLGNGDQINMPENIFQSPHYSIRYGFREGAQKDIFINTNPRRHVAVQVPVERKCNSSTKSRIVQPAGWPMLTNLTSPTCRCTAARLSNGEIRIYDNTTHVSTVMVGGDSGPIALVRNETFKAGTQYFPLANADAYRMDLSDKCYLYVTDAKGVVVWESMFVVGKYVVNSFTGMMSDPPEWPADGKIYTESPTSRPTLKPISPKPTTAKPSLRPISSKPTTSRPTSIPTPMPSATPTTKTPTVKPTTMMPVTKHPTMNPTSNPSPKPTTRRPSVNNSTSTSVYTQLTTSKPTMLKLNESFVPTTNLTSHPTSMPSTTSEPSMTSEPYSTSEQATSNHQDILSSNVFN